MVIKIFDMLFFKNLTHFPVQDGLRFQKNKIFGNVIKINYISGHLNEGSSVHFKNPVPVEVRIPAYWL